MDIQKIATAAGSAGIVGAVFASGASGSKDKFKDTKKKTTTTKEGEKDTDAEINDLMQKFEVVV